MISIRRAIIEDIPTIMQFMEDYWLHGYALAQNRDFFDWQFVHDGKVNIWIGIDDEINKLYAMQSYIPYRHTPNPDISGSVWLAIKSPNSMLAFEIQDVMWADILPRTSPSPGLRPDAVKAYSLMGYPITQMDHYYRLSDRDSYKIAIINTKSIPKVIDSGYKLAPCEDLSEFENIISEDYLISRTPSKDYSYIKWRYYDHPIFSYDLWKIIAPDESPAGILVTRTEHANDASSCKIVDFYGEPQILSKLSHEFDCLMEEKNYEYIDIYSYGIPVEIYENGGLTKCDSSSSNIITNLLFCQRNF